MPSVRPTSDLLLRRIRHIILLILGLAFVGCSLPFIVWRLCLDSALDDHLTRLKAAGCPISSNELSAWHRETRDDENGSALFLNAVEDLDFSSNPASDALALMNRYETYELSMEARLKLTTWLNLHRDILADLHVAALRKTARYPLDFSTTADLQELHQLKAAAFLLKGEALDYADRRRFDCAAESIEAIYRSIDWANRSCMSPW